MFTLWQPPAKKFYVQHPLQEEPAASLPPAASIETESLDDPELTRCVLLHSSQPTILSLHPTLLSLPLQCTPLRMCLRNTCLCRVDRSASRGTGGRNITTRSRRNCGVVDSIVA